MFWCLGLDVCFVVILGLIVGVLICCFAFWLGVGWVVLFGLLGWLGGV